MIIKTQNGVFITGTVSRDAIFMRAGDRETPITRFSVKYDTVDRKSLWFDVVSFFEVAKLAAFIKTGATVMISGRLQSKRDRIEEEEVVADSIIFQNQISDNPPITPRTEHRNPKDIRKDEDDAPVQQPRQGISEGLASDSDLPF